MELNFHLLSVSSCAAYIAVMQTVVIARQAFKDVITLHILCQMFKVPKLKLPEHSSVPCRGKGFYRYQFRAESQFRRNPSLALTVTSALSVGLGGSNSIFFFHSCVAQKTESFVGSLEIINKNCISQWSLMIHLIARKSVFLQNRRGTKYASITIVYIPI